jgi:hypothetical protein
VNIDRIHKGFIAKNYKHMCEVLREEVKAGNSKKSQMKVWSCYFDFKLNKQKIEVLKVFKSPRTLPNLTGGNHVPYLESINELLIQILLKSIGYKFILPKNRILLMLNMINVNYKSGKDNIEDLSNYLNMEKIDVYDFYNSTDDTLKRNLESSLKDLKNKKAIFFKTVLMICKGNDVRKANDDEEQMILYLQSKALEQMNYRGLIEVYRDGKLEEFTKTSNKILLKNMGISYVYEAYDITLNRDKLNKLKAINELKIKKMNKELNNSVKKRLSDNAQKRVSRAQQEYDIGFGEYVGKKEFRVREDYLKKQEILIDLLVDNSQKIIVNNLEKSNDIKG